MSRQETGLFAPFEYPFSDGSSSSSPKDTLATPELITDHSYRISSIIRPGGEGHYDFKDLALPEGWQEVGEGISAIDWERQRKIFEIVCAKNYALPGDLIVEPSTGLLKEVRVEVDKKYGGGQATVALNRDGEYRASKMSNARMFAPLMGTVASFLNKVQYLRNDERQIMSIAHGNQGYYSTNLLIPDTCLKSEGPVTTPEYQAEFKKKAQEIGVKLGDKVKWAHFDEQGILNNVSLSWGFGGACSYELDRRGFGKSAYSPHNVDGARQAAVLHSVVASFINDMLDQGHIYTPFGIYDAE